MTKSNYRELLEIAAQMVCDVEGDSYDGMDELSDADIRVGLFLYPDIENLFIAACDKFGSCDVEYHKWVDNHPNRKIA